MDVVFFAAVGGAAWTASRDRKDCMGKFRKAWEAHCTQPGWLDEFLAMKRRR